MNLVLHYVFTLAAFVVTLFFIRTAGRIVRESVPRNRTLVWDNLKIAVVYAAPSIMIGILLLVLRNASGRILISTAAVWVSLMWDGAHIICVLYYISKLRQLQRLPDTFFFEVKVTPYNDWPDSNLLNIFPSKFWGRGVSLPVFLQPLFFLLSSLGTGKTTLRILYGDLFRFLNNDLRYVDVFDDIWKALPIKEKELWSVPHLAVKDAYAYRRELFGFPGGLLRNAVKEGFERAVSSATEYPENQIVADVLKAVSSDDDGPTLSKRASRSSSRVFLTNRTINAGLPVVLWETSCRLCQTTPSIIAATWKLYHFQEDIRLRFVTLFNTADLLQRLIGALVLRMLAETDELNLLLAHPEFPSDKENRPIFPPNTAGDWNRVLQWTLKNSESEQLDIFRQMLLTPQPDFNESVEKLSPFWQILRMSPQIPPTEQNALSRFAVLSLLRNKTIGHGSVGWKLQLRPAVYLSALHHFFLRTVEDISKLSMMVVAYEDRENDYEIVAILQGLFVTEFEMNDGEYPVIMENPANGRHLDMYPYLRFCNRRLLIVDRFSKDRSHAVYVDYDADKIAEPSFIDLNIDSF